MFGLLRRKQRCPINRPPPAERNKPPAPQHPGAIREVLTRIDEHIRARDAVTDNKIDEVARRITAVVAERLDRHTETTAAAFTRHMDAIGEGLHKSLEAIANDRLTAIGDGLKDVLSEAAVRSVQRPVIDRLIALLDRLQSEKTFLAAMYQRDADATNNLSARRLHEQHDAALASFIDELRTFLRQLDVTPIEAPAGPLNPRHQQVVGIEETSNPDLDGNISQIVRAGYLWHGAILRCEQVKVYKLKENE